MKKIIGLFAGLLTLIFIVLLILRIWDVNIVSMQTIIRSSVTLLVLGVTIIILVIIYAGFFKNTRSSYDKTKGDRAHPKL